MILAANYVEFRRIPTADAAADLLTRPLIIE